MANRQAIGQFLLTPETAEFNDAIEELHKEIFGPARFTKAASLLRESYPLDYKTSFVIFKDDKLIASLRMSNIERKIAPYYLLGPLAVAAPYRGQALGRLLLETAIAKAKQEALQPQMRDHSGIFLIGDYAYYGKFGFAPIKKELLYNIDLPAPADPKRCLFLSFSNEKQEISSNSAMRRE